MPDCPVLLVGPESRAIRAAVGPTAWTVLEELSLSVRPDDAGRLVARTSVRRLGAVLGLDKDTVARALGRLCAAGFVARTTASGKSAYVVMAVAGLCRVDREVVVPARPHERDSGPVATSGARAASLSYSRARRPATRRVVDRAQLSLLDVEVNTTIEPTDNTTTTTTPQSDDQADGDHDDTDDDSNTDESQ